MRAFSCWKETQESRVRHQLTPRNEAEGCESPVSKADSPKHCQPGEGTQPEPCLLSGGKLSGKEVWLAMVGSIGQPEQGPLGSSQQRGRCFRFAPLPDPAEHHCLDIIFTSLRVM